MKTDRLLEDIKTKLDILDVISGYVSLKKSGQNWKGLCPFHAEKTPSFMVNPSKQIFHCFGCGAGGDIFSFVQKHENMTFGETVKMLAEKAGITITPARYDRKAADKDERLRNTLAEAADFYLQCLKAHKGAASYLAGRGISADIAAAFKIGYAPEHWDALLKYLGKRGFEEAFIRAAGLAAQGSKGLYDMFRSRIMFPIMNMQGAVIAFGGRTLGDATPKYINSPETSLFRKSETLYGLYQAKDEIRKQSSVIVTEGYIDVVIAHQYGFRNTVAPLGTALTEKQVQRLKKLADRALLVFDGDPAGIAAAKRTLSLVCRNGLRAKVVMLPRDEDPDSFLRKRGRDAFQEALDKGSSIVDFLVRVSKGEKTDTAREALALIAEVEDLLVADEMLVELSERTRTSEAVLREELKRLRKKEPVPVQAGLNRKIVERHAEEHLLLSAVITFPEKAANVLSRINLNDFLDKVVASLLKKISETPDRSELMSLLENADEEERRIFTAYSVDPGFDLEEVDRNLEDCLRRIETRKLDERIMKAAVSGDRGLSNQLLNEKKKLIKEKGL